MARTKFKNQVQEVEEDFEDDDEAEVEVEVKPGKERSKEKDKGRSSKKSRNRDSGRVRKGGKSSNAIIRYFQDTGDELRKVTWPSRETTTRLSVIVLVAMAISTLVLWILDYAFQQSIAFLIKAGQ